MLICLLFGHSPDRHVFTVGETYIPIAFTVKDQPRSMQWFPCKRCGSVCAVFAESKPAIVHATITDLAEEWTR